MAYLKRIKLGKNHRITFRTNDECNDHLKAIQDKYELPISDIVHRMIRYFAKSGDAMKTFNELHNDALHK